MSTFTREELLKVAELSLLKLQEKEVDLFASQLQVIIDYTQELANVDTKNVQEPIRPINVFREDKVVRFDSEAILNNAAQTEEQYFVLPQIINQQ